MDVDGTDTTYEHNVVNEMTKEDGSTKTYDDNGNFEGTSNAYKYDWRNSLAYHDDGADEFTWHFDAFGRRVQRDKDGATNSQRSYFDGNHKVETVAYRRLHPISETHKKTFVFGARIDELLLYVDVNASPDKEYYAHADHLGSIMLMVDDAGAIQESYRYTEWGEHTILDDTFTRLSAGAASPVGNGWRYTGRGHGRVVAGSGETWYDYRARHYRAGVGRFVQRDPLGYVDGASAYSYAIASPVMFVDPLGQACQLSLDHGEGYGSSQCGIHHVGYGQFTPQPDESHCGGALVEAEIDSGLPDDNSGGTPCDLAPIRGGQPSGSGLVASGPLPLQPAPAAISAGLTVRQTQSGGTSTIAVTDEDGSASTVLRQPVPAGMSDGQSVLMKFCWWTFIPEQPGTYYMLCVVAEVTCECD